MVNYILYAQTGGENRLALAGRFSVAGHFGEGDGVKNYTGVVGAEAAEGGVGEFPDGVAGEILEVGFPFGEEFVVEQGADAVFADLDGQRVAMAVGDGHGGDGGVVFGDFFADALEAGFAFDIQGVAEGVVVGGQQEGDGARAVGAAEGDREVELFRRVVGEGQRGIARGCDGEAGDVGVGSGEKGPFAFGSVLGGIDQREKIDGGGGGREENFVGSRAWGGGGLQAAIECAPA